MPLMLALLLTPACLHQKDAIDMNQARAELQPETIPTVAEAEIYFDKSWNDVKRSSRFQTPRDGVEVRATLMRALTALEKSNFAEAHSHFKAILATDLLTEEGRLSMYWYAAKAAEEANDHVSARDAMGGYVIAATLLDSLTSEQAERYQSLKASLLAHKVASKKNFGRSPDMAIPISNANESTSIVKALSCGPSGSLRFHVMSEDVINADEYGHLMKQRAFCGATGTSVSLWFNISQ